MLLLIQYTLIFASVLTLVALGGCYSEHSGVINLGLEGIMVMGALGGALAMRYLPIGIPAFFYILLVIFFAVIAQCFLRARDTTSATRPERAAIFHSTTG